MTSVSSTRNPYLTAGMERVLKAMDAEGPDGELTVEGREAWYGLERTSVAMVYRLLRLCLLHDDTKDGATTDSNYRYYSLNEEGRKILRDPAYVPLIVKAQSEIKRETK